LLNGVEQNCKRWGDTMLFGKGKGKQEKISEVNPVCCTERVSDEAVETTGPRDEDVAGNQCFAFVREDLTEEHKAYLSTILSDLTHLKYGFWVDNKNKTYFFGTGSQVHDCLEFYTLLYKGTGYHVTTEYLPYSKEYMKCVMIPQTNRQGEDVYEEIKAVVTEIFRCMYGHSVNLCFPDNPEFNSLRSNM